MHPNTYSEMQKFAARLPRAPLRIGDVGSYDVNGTYRAIFASEPRWTYVGMDMAAGNNVDIVLNGEDDWNNVPEASFDVVISGQTMEHTRRPWIFARQLARLGKRGALFCVIAPFTWPYHCHPIDCWRVFPDGMRAVLEDAGLLVLETYMTQITATEGDTIAIASKP